MILGKTYLGNTEINKIYLGSNLIYDNTTPSAANLLFATNFEDNVVLSEQTLSSTGNGGYRYFSGTDLSTGFTLPDDTDLGLGFTQNRLQIVHYGDIPNVQVAIVETIGRTGATTKVLHSQIDEKYGNDQIAWQFLPPAGGVAFQDITPPPEIYFSWWMKVGSPFLSDIAGAGVTGDGWDSRVLFEYKTSRYEQGDNSGGRIIVEQHLWNGVEYIVMQLDRNDQSLIWQEYAQFVLPRDEWFFFEVYIKWGNNSDGADSPTGTGEVWVKINNDTKLLATNVSTTRNNDPMGYYFVSNCYGSGKHQDQMIDEVKIYDGIPY